MRRLDAVSDRMRGRLGGGAHERLHVSVLCDCGEEFLAHREAETARCPTCKLAARVLGSPARQRGTPARKRAGDPGAGDPVILAARPAA